MAWLRRSCSEHSIESLLGRQGALEREFRVCKRVDCVEDIFVTGQVALYFGVPDSELYTSKEQECAVGQHDVVGGPSRLLLVSRLVSSRLMQSQCPLTERDILSRAKDLRCACHQVIAQMSSNLTSAHSV